MDDTLRNEIAAFIKAHSMSSSAFGEAALGDRHFLRQIAKGREPRRATVEKVRRFMAEYAPQRVAA